MAIPGQKESIPTRIFTESTVGSQRFVPPETAGTPSPVSNPTAVVSQLWSNQYSFQVSTGTTIPVANSLTLSQQIPFTNIPALTIPQNVSMILQVVPWQYNTITGLCQQGIYAQGIASIGAAQFRGNTFQGGQTYSGFGSVVTVILFNATGSGIGASTITLYADVEITAQ